MVTFTTLFKHCESLCCLLVPCQCTGYLWVIVSQHSVFASLHLYCNDENIAWTKAIKWYMQLSSASSLRHTCSIQCGILLPPEEMDPTSCPSAQDTYYCTQNWSVLRSRGYTYHCIGLFWYKLLKRMVHNAVISTPTSYVRSFESYMFFSYFSL
jgi:hypothetical protein